MLGPMMPPAPLGKALPAALSYHVEYALSYSLISLTSPVTFSVVDAIRRLSIIVAGKVMFRRAEEGFTGRNVAGMCMAVGGGLGYSYFKK